MFAADIRWLSDQQISTGYDSGNGTRRFEPSAPVLREQMAAFLYRLAGRPQVNDLPTTSPFTDVPTSHTFYREIVWLSRAKISTGYVNGNGTARFEPSAPVLREQMAAFLYRFKSDQDDAPPVSPSSGPGFTDVAANHVFTAEIRWLASTGITTGYDNGNGTSRFAPSSAVLREQMAAFMSRYANGATVRASLTSAGTQLDGDISGRSDISSNGRYLAFSSVATNLAPGGPVGVEQIYVRDLWSGSVKRVSVSSAGVPASRAAYVPSISGDGRLVTFYSWASDLVPDDTNHEADVFVHDVQNGTTKRVSVGSNGEQGSRSSFSGEISDDGRFVAFDTTDGYSLGVEGAGQAEVFVHELSTGITSLVSAYGYEDEYAPEWTEYYYHAASSPSISPDGRYVAFVSNLLVGHLDPGSRPQSVPHVFVRDRVTGTIELVTVAHNGHKSFYGSSNPSISDDGRYVSFSSSSEVLVPGDSNGSGEGFTRLGSDVFVRDLETNTTTRVSVSSHGAQGDRNAMYAEISGDGRYVVFPSDSSTLVAGDTNGMWDMFVHDRETGHTRRINVSSAGAQANGPSGHFPAVSNDGRVIVFGSGASNLVPGDTNGSSDYFLRVRQR